jgi:hypothetical protein
LFNYKYLSEDLTVAPGPRPTSKEVADEKLDLQSASNSVEDYRSGDIWIVRSRFALAMD